MNYEQLLYSLQEELTITKIKKEEYSQDIDTSKIKKRTDDNSVFCLQLGEQDYHFKFESIKAKPYFVYYKGDISLLNKPILSIVGPRKISDYAIKVLEELFKHLKKYNCVTISGLADGVDSQCHSLSIKYGIPTIAVLGGGLGWFMQSSNRGSIDKIVENGGLVISEFKLKKEPTTYTFPQRNRIIAGLSKVVFVPEAGEKSGTLITVNDAIGMHIPVYATSNSIFEKNSKGINKLIGQKKVSLVFDFDKFISEYFQKNTKKSLFSEKNIANHDSLSILQKQILKIIAENGGASTDELQSKLNLDVSEIFTELTMLEIEGIIAQLKPNIYEII